MGGHSGGFVDDDQVRILIEDRKRQDLGLGAAGATGGRST
jgi:hypothetical protein